MARALPHLRAAFVLFHLLAVGLAAFPSPDAGLRRKAWADPTVQAEFRAWAPRFGLEVADFERRLWDAATTWTAVRKLVLTPFRPYLEATGTVQSWQMFVAPHKWPTRLQIQTRPTRTGTWTTRYEEQSPSARWHEPALRTERMRATIFRWGWPGYATAYRRGCNALAQRLFAEEPEIVAVRCRFWKQRSRSAAEVRAEAAPEGKWLTPVVIER